MQSTLNFIGTPFVALNVMECFDVKKWGGKGREGKEKEQNNTIILPRLSVLMMAK